MKHNWSATKQRLHPQCSRDKPPFSFVRGHDLTIWDIVWVSPQGHRSVSVSRHFLLQTPQCPCFVRKRFSRDLCYWGRSKHSCQIVGSHTRWELTIWADFQLCLHRLLTASWWKMKAHDTSSCPLSLPSFSFYSTMCLKYNIFWFLNISIKNKLIIIIFGTWEPE